MALTTEGTRSGFLLAPPQPNTASRLQGNKHLSFPLLVSNIQFPCSRLSAQNTLLAAIFLFRSGARPTAH